MEDGFLQLKGISKTFNEINVLNNFNLDLKSGEVHAIVGNNCSGKSTLVKIVGGQLLPDSGEILIDKTPITLSNSVDRINCGVSIIFHPCHLITNFSVIDNLVLAFSKNRNLFSKWGYKSPLPEEAQDIITIFGLQSILKRNVDTLSFSQRKLVSLAKALFVKPRFLIIDEPFVSLDSISEKVYKTALNYAKLQGIGLLLTTQNLDEVLDIIDKITILNHGQNVMTAERKDLDSQTLLNLLLNKEMSVNNDETDKTTKSFLVRFIQSKEDERTRIASELHDGLNQYISGTLMEIQSCINLISSQPEVVPSLLGETLVTITHMRNEINRIINNLNPHFIENIGLEKAMLDFVQIFAKKTGIQCDFSVSGTNPRTSKSIILSFYRVLQEALHNIWKHSGSPTADITLKTETNVLKLTITDFGCGFDIEKVNKDFLTKAHHGLRFMNIRAQGIGAKLNIHSQKSKGTTIEYSVTLSKGCINEDN